MGLLRRRRAVPRSVPNEHPRPLRPEGVVAVGDGRGLRVLLVQSEAASAGTPALGRALAEALHLATAEPVVVESLLGDERVGDGLEDAGLEHADAVVVDMRAGTGRDAPSPDEWCVRMEDLRDVLLARIEPDAVLVVLAPSSDDRHLDAVTDDVLAGFRQISLVRSVGTDASRRAQTISGALLPRLQARTPA